MKLAKVKELTMMEVWVSCPYCKRSYSSVEIVDNKIKCPKCGDIFGVEPDDKILPFLDKGSFRESED